MNSRSLLPLFFGLTSLTAVACAAPVGAPSEEPSVEERGASAEVGGDEIASKLSGSVGSRVDGALANAELPETDETMTTTVTELVVQPGPTETVYEVFSYSFGIDTAVALGRAGAEAEKSSLVPLSVAVRPVKMGSPALMSRLVMGQHIDKLVLRQRTVGTKLTAANEIAEFGSAFVSSMSTGIEGGTIDSYSLEIGKVTVKLPGSTAGVSHDALVNQAAGEALCGDRGNANLGPYVQADPSWMLPKGAVRIDAATVAISNAPAMATGAGAGAGKAKLEQIAITSPMEKTGLCALYYSSLGARVPAVRIDAATSVDAAGALMLDQRWEACGAYATQVVFTGGSGQAPRQTITLTAEGVVRTDFAGSKAQSVFGWSFVQNTNITSCK